MAREKPPIIIYQKPTCSTCREVVKLVAASGQPYRAINYYEQPFTKEQLKTLLKNAGLRPKDLLRTKEDLYRTLKLGERSVEDDELIALMLRYPDLIQRPLVEKGDEVVLARPAESVTRLLKR